MTTILAALDNSVAAAPVLANALALGRMLDSDVRAIHIVTDGSRTARGAADAAGIPLATPLGPVVDRLRAEAEADDVRALVLGARRTPAGRRPLGRTALTIATSVSKPVLVVPPDAKMPTHGLRRVLVPVEGQLSRSLTPRAIVELAKDAELDVVILYVHDEKALPAFTDQPQHEQTAWTREFLRRYCPWGVGRIQLEVRVGRVDDLIVAVADQVRVDVVALGWAQHLSEGRAPVVRAALEHGHVPVLLVPVDPTRVAARGTDGPAIERLALEQEPV